VFAKQKSSRHDVLGELFGAVSSPGIHSEGAEQAHLAHKAHFAPAPKLQSFKLEEKNKNREDIKGDSTHTEAALRFVRQVRSASDLPAIATAIRDQITLENVARLAELFQRGF
jgi:hypothetical protein